MGQIVPDLVEQYLAGLNRLPDAVLQDIASAGAAQDLPLVDAEVGALLRVLATAIGATRMLEIGTAIGYSGIWLAGALPPGGMLLTMEMDPERATIARENFARAGLADRVTVIVGDAERMLPKVAGPFDLIFQDGDKRLYSVDARSARRAAAARAACWSPTTCCGTARSCPGSSRSRSVRSATRERLPTTTSASLRTRI